MTDQPSKPSEAARGWAERLPIKVCGHNCAPAFCTTCNRLEHERVMAAYDAGASAALALAVREVANKIKDTPGGSGVLHGLEVALAMLARLEGKP